MNKEKCNPAIFEHGEFYTIEELSKQEAELLCEQMTADLKDNYIYDWHFVAGGVRIIRLHKDSPHLK